MHKKKVINGNVNNIHLSSPYHLTMQKKANRSSLSNLVSNPILFLAGTSCPALRTSVGFTFCKAPVETELYHTAVISFLKGRIYIAVSADGTKLLRVKNVADV